ncbi:probable polygalacturonase At3g15720 isoform X2 [Durio zibethinus]|uniref:Probable polygalacturonase At3g15720 isoform X2 n=1 Tax=Durio zibethinus TaxID=66656 RepID=A0A6P5WJ68_DURZI|nr:probable polygalacturonase At3g15720 isoform X2 [Durio zibethinus]
MALLVIAFFILNFGFGIGNCQSLNVINFGAVGDGRTDDLLAFSKAWTALCAATNNPTLEIPSAKTFLLSSKIDFSGPCKSKSIHIKVLGNIIAPKSNTWTKCDNGCWLCFSNVAGLTVDGTGQIDGNGAAWWNKTPNECAPAVISFENCNNLNFHGITSLNSPGNHVSVNRCEEVDISHIQLIAPKDSPNTDGIDISSSTALRISDCFFGTGDDCIAINGGSSHINITRLTCGPGHGISVGSLGKNGKNETVEWVQVENSIFNGTQNGARIKTWVGGAGFARDISFVGVQLINAENPIIIDQHYCPHQTCQPEAKTAVKISNVRFSGFKGTSATEVAIKLDCSSIVPCTGITLSNNMITSSTPGKKVKAECHNAHVSSNLTTPSVTCLTPNHISVITPKLKESTYEQ